MKEVRLESKILIHALFCIMIVAVLFVGTLLLQAQGFQLGGWPLLAARYAFFIFCIYLGRWICNQWFSKKNYLLLLLYVLLSCIGISLTWWLIIRYIFGALFAGLLEVVISAMPFFAIAMVSGILLTLIRITMKIQVQQARVMMEQKQSELDLLQSQLSPHFLFNTLNNLYGISLTQQSRVPKLLLQLSDLLRYAVYDTKNAFVDITDEIKYIHNFIDFEKIRIGDRLLLDTEIEEITGNGIMVAPMVFIVFIENAFKHAKNTFDQKIYISVRLYIERDELVFGVKNSFGPSKPGNDAINKHSGLGLVNTIKRLDLLYKKNYRLKQYSEDQLYHIELRLPIQML